MTQKLAIAALVLAATAGTASAEKIKFEYWYGLTGDLGAVVAETCSRFNASQDQYEAVCVGQDGYDKAVQNTIAAFRAGKHPTLLQSFDAGTADLMLSGEFYPVYQMMADHGVTIDWAELLPRHRQLLFPTSKGNFVSMPFNSSTPVYYFNADQFAKAGITEAPLTWEGMEAAFKALKASGVACPYAYEPSVWIDIEQFSMAHNVPVASNDNGYSGIDTELLFNTTLHVQHMENIQRWIGEGLAQMRTQASGKTARDSFVEGECSVFFSSIADHNTVHKLKPAFGWDVQMIPTYEGHRASQHRRRRRLAVGAVGQDRRRIQGRGGLSGRSWPPPESEAVLGVEHRLYPGDQDRAMTRFWPRASTTTSPTRTATSR